MTEEQITQLQALEEKATPGPWKHNKDKGHPPCRFINSGEMDEIAMLRGHREWPLQDANADLIVASRNALPGLLKELLSERAKLQIAVKVLEAIVDRSDSDSVGTVRIVREARKEIEQYGK